MRASTQQRLKLNRSTCHTWTIKEQLYLASSVVKLGDQNWLKVSRLLKYSLQPDFQRPLEWLTKTCCASQYARLLDKANLRKKIQGRKITGHTIVRKLTEKRIREINLLLGSQRDEYQKLKYELNLVTTGNLTEEELQKMCLQIELEEQEPEQEPNLKTHIASLAKSSEHVVQISKSSKFVIPEKSRSSDGYYKLDPSSTIMKENNKDGRSLLRKNLSKSQLNRKESPQFHQLVPITIDNAASERSSIEARNVSMLLDLPANLQRTTLPNLELQTSTKNLPESHLNLQMISKDIMDDVPEKKDINEIIDNIEKLTMKEIINNSQVLDPESVRVMDKLMSQFPLVPDKQKIKPVPTTKYFSDYPENDVEIEEIDPISFNIAEIIGLVEKVPLEESKSGKEVEATKSSISSEESKNEEVEDKKGSKLIEDFKVGIEETTKETCEEGLELIKDSKVEIEETRIGKKCEKNSELTEDPKVGIEEAIKRKKSDKEKIIASFMDDLKKSPFKKEDLEMCTEKDTEKSLKKNREESAKDDAKNEIQENEKENMLHNLEESPYKKLKLTFETENFSDKNVIMDIIEVDNDEDVGQLELELNLTKITGDENVPSTKVLSIFSHDPLCLEDSEDQDQTQEIIWILEHTYIETSLKDNVIKNKEDLMIEPVEEGAELSESFTEDFTLIKEESKEDEMEELGEDDTKDFPDRALIAEVIVDDFKDLEEEEREMTEKSDPLKETEDLLSEGNSFTDKEIRIELIKEECEFCEETSPDEEMKEMKDKENNHLNEKELTLIKRNEERVIKTYSKKKKTTGTKKNSEIERSKESSDYKAWKKAVMMVYDKLATSKCSSVFFKPITEDQAPGYHSIVFRPMDLTTIKKNIDNGTIRSTKHFQRDVMLMFQNAIMYNKRNSSIYKMAISMQDEFLQDIQILEKVSREVSCRETRKPVSISNEASESGVKKISYNTSSSRGTGTSRKNKRAKVCK